MPKVVLSAAIMTHPARTARARRLYLQFPGWDLRIISDPFPAGGPATLRTARAAWDAVGRGATHHLVLQDDVNCLPSLLRHVATAAAWHPDKALAFFAEWGSRTASTIRMAALRGESWAEVVDEYIPAQALLLPGEVARGAAEFLRMRPDDEPDDVALRQYLSQAGLRQLVSVPNLVEHADVPSLIGNTLMGLRRSACWSLELAGTGLRGEAACPRLSCVPYYAWWDGRTESCVPRLDEPISQWPVTPTAAMLATALEVPASAIDAACTEGLREVSPSASGLVDEDSMRQLWFTAFALGVVATDGPRRITEDALRSPVTRLAMSSLVPGALRTVLEPADQARAAEILTPVMHAAVRAGCLSRVRVEPRDHLIA